MFRWIVAVLFILLTSPVMAEEAGENTAVNADNMAAVEKNSDAAKSVDNGLDINTDIQPLKAEMSENEKSQTSDIFAADDNEMTELKCDDARLKKQIVDFVFHTISKNPTTSVLENRSRVLLVRNMHDFQEIDPQLLFAFIGSSKKSKEKFYGFASVEATRLKVLTMSMPLFIRFRDITG